jgi:thioredoxin-related protein
MFVKIISSLILFVFMMASCRHADKTLIQVPPVVQIQKGTLEELSDQAKAGHKKLFLVFSFEKCGWCRIFEKYHSDPRVNEILSKYFIVSKIDYYKTPDGQELYRKYGLPGFPSWVILDESGSLLISSEAPVPGIKDEKYNIGYPSGKNEMDYYIRALKKSAPDLTNSECQILREKLSEARNYPFNKKS